MIVTLVQELVDGVVILSLFKINYDKPGRGVERTSLKNQR